MIKRFEKLLESIPKLEDEINELSTKLKQQEEKDKKMINQMKVMNEDMEKLKQNCKKKYQVYQNTLLWIFTIVIMRKKKNNGQIYEVNVPKIYRQK
ncbi:unnamed protein product [Paramecium octaurelia]|uniref:Uncharacterized protein n=1 Tax=Paramecium octaurelia TaxID=43137 RepID=A0A8S1XI17_PAROT|nr:unnamed protein product [Paramecium octaurelia]